MSAATPSASPAADRTYYVAAVMPDSGRVEDGDPFPFLDAADEYDMRHPITPRPSSASG